MHRLKSQMSLRIIWKILCYIQGSSMQNKLSLIAAEVKLPTRLRSNFEGLKDFFNVGKEKLTATQRKAGNEHINEFIRRSHDFDMTLADEDIVMLIAMSVVAKARNTTVDDLFYAVFSAGNIEQQEIVAEFSKYGLEDSFWKWQIAGLDMMIQNQVS